MTGDKMAQNKIQASTVIIVTILLTAGLLVAANINKCSASVVTQSATLRETDTVANEAIVAVVINEFMADNDAAVESPYGTYPDWIELYNWGDATVDLSGMYLTDDLADPTWQFDDGIVIGPKSYLLIWADGQPGRGALHTSFRVLANGGTLGLFASDGETLIDSVVYDKQLRDISYGRIADGDPSWSYLETATAGEANIANARAPTSTPWPIWILIILALAACIAVLLKDKIRARRKK